MDTFTLANIKAEVEEILDDQGYEYTTSAIDKICDKNNKAKERLRNLFRKHPNWDESNQMIVFKKSQYERVVNLNEINRIINSISVNYDTVLTPLDAFVAIEIWDKIKDWVKADTFSNTLTEEECEYFTEQAKAKGLDNIKPVVGQRITKVIRKFLLAAGADKWPNYNSIIAKIGDAINPFKIERHTCISINLIDYLLMSNGDNWNSCHDIRRDEYEYEAGCYSSGTLSYALDETSVVFYTVDSSYKGDDFARQPKTSRQMFYIGEDMMIQSRLYPQSNDTGAGGLYQQIREVMEKTIADLWEVPNFWSVGQTDRDLIKTWGTHYPDYNYDGYPTKMIKLKGKNDFKKIIIGHDPICINCGYTHTERETIDCCSVNTCYECRERVGSNGIYYGGEYYCEECCEYCEYHGEYEPRDRAEMFYVDNYGWICNDGACCSDEIIYCENCGEYHSADEEIYTEDGHWYCCEDCAEYAGYHYVSSREEYIHEDNLIYCSECGEFIHIDDSYQTENGDCYCGSCFKELEEEEVA